MIVAGGQLHNLTRARGLGFLPSDTGGEIGGGLDWWDDWLFVDYYYPDYSGGGGGDYWSNFDPVTGDYIGQGGAQNYSWWDNFDPITGDWIGQGGTIDTIDTTEPGSLPSGPSGNWWGGLIDFFSGIVSPGYQPDFSSGVPPAPTPNLPGYCPAGTYHPIDDPFACVPFPPSPAQPGQTPRTPVRPTPGPMTRSSSQPQAPKCPQGQIFSQQYNRCIPQCPQGQVFNPQTNKCQAAPKCPQGMQFDPVKGTCVQVLAQQGSSFPWWMWLLIAGGAAYALSGEEKRQPPRRRKR